MQHVCQQTPATSLLVLASSLLAANLLLWFLTVGTGQHLACPCGDQAGTGSSRRRLYLCDASRKVVGEPLDVQMKQILDQIKKLEKRLGKLRKKRKLPTLTPDAFLEQHDDLIQLISALEDQYTSAWVENYGTEHSTDTALDEIKCMFALKIPQITRSIKKAYDTAIDGAEEIPNFAGSRLRDELRADPIADKVIKIAMSFAPQIIHLIKSEVIEAQTQQLVKSHASALLWKGLGVSIKNDYKDKPWYQKVFVSPLKTLGKAVGGGVLGGLYATGIGGVGLHYATRGLIGYFMDIELKLLDDVGEHIMDILTQDKKYTTLLPEYEIPRTLSYSPAYQP